MKATAIAIVALVIYAFALWIINGLLSWIIVGIIIGIALSIWSSISYDLSYAKEQAVLDSEGLDLDARKVPGNKNNSTLTFIVINIVVGFISYGIDVFFTTPL